MNTLDHIDKLLHQRIGMDFTTVGSSVISYAIQIRMRMLRITDIDQYHEYLLRDAYELDLLINEVVVPETWFFRDYTPFQHLEQRARKFFQQQTGRPLRVLSLPCATGEEPYSIAMTLMSVEPDTRRWHIDAFDISSAAIRFAKNGLYHAHSFREQRTHRCMERFFVQQNERYQLADEIRNTVRFNRANIVDPAFRLPKNYYDIIFFRNLLIYFNQEDKRKSLDIINSALTQDGVLIVGHAEAACIPAELFEVTGAAEEFAFTQQQRKKPGASPQHKKPTRARKTRREKSAQKTANKRPELDLCSGIRLLSKPAAPPRIATPPLANRQQRLDTTAADCEQPGKQPDLDQAFALANRGEYDMAMHICMNTLKTDPANDRCHYLLGLIHDARGDRAQGESYLRKAVYLNPDYHEAMVHLALLLEHRGLKKQAARLRERAERKIEAERNAERTRDDIDKAM